MYENQLIVTGYKGNQVTNYIKAYVRNLKDFMCL